LIEKSAWFIWPLRRDTIRIAAAWFSAVSAEAMDHIGRFGDRKEPFRR